MSTKMGVATEQREAPDTEQLKPGSRYAGTPQSSAPADAPRPSSFIVERYLTARRIYKCRDERAHDGFQWRGQVVPAQNFAEWFGWCYGMTLDAYATLARENDHAALVKALGAVLVEYRIGERWLTAIGSPDDTYETLSAAILAQFPQIVEVRPRP